MTNLNLVDFNCSDDIKQYWNTLKDLGMFFHLDDDPGDCFDPGPATDMLTINHKNMWLFCDQNGIDPWDIEAEWSAEREAQKAAENKIRREIDAEKLGIRLHDAGFSSNASSSTDFKPKP